MKGVALIFAILFGFSVLSSHAQEAVVRVGDIPVTFKNGKISVEQTTRDRIIRAGKLVARADCVIVSYTFSIMKGDNMWGPVKVRGGLFTTDMVNHLKETKGPNVNVVFDEIKVKQDGLTRSSHPIALKYDQ